MIFIYVKIGDIQQHLDGGSFVLFEVVLNKKINMNSF